MSSENPRFNYTGQAWEGKEYESTKDLSTTEIAKLIRAELKYKFQQYKFSIRTRYFAGGSAIDVEFVGGLGVEIFTPQFIEYLRGDQNMAFTRDRYTDEFKAVRKAVESIVNKYNFNDSDGMIDYFHTRFYGSVKIDYSYEHQLEKQAQMLVTMLQ